MKFRLKLNHLFVSRCCWVGHLLFNETRNRCIYIYIPFENLGDAWVAEGGALDESILISFCSKLMQIADKTHIRILKLIYLQVLICFSMFDYFEIPLSCFGKLVFFLHVRENTREVGRIFGSFSSAKRWFPC